jgi:hypothetical protein
MFESADFDQHKVLVTRHPHPRWGVQQAVRTEGGSVGTSNAFHDRFLIIDDSDYYHFGASLKDAGTRGFMFSRIEEPPVIDMLRRSFEEEWLRAQAVV